MFRNTQELLAFIQAGNRVKYLHFWGHKPSGNRVDKSCLSQWFPAHFVLEGVEYLTAEHYMMAQKARLFHDNAMLEAILACNHPHAAKKFGRKVTPFNPHLWNRHCFDFVVQGNVAKFAQNPALKAFLLNTKQRVLVEASPRDQIWGIGMGMHHPNAFRPQAWRGKNLLGFALMMAREQLQNSA